MSRSKRKTPIYGTTGARSEAVDKKHWHQRLRAAERSRLAHNTGDHIPVDEREVSDPWGMAKDGKRYWKVAMRTRAAERVAARAGREQLETSSLKVRQLAKWNSK